MANAVASLCEISTSARKNFLKLDEDGASAAREAKGVLFGCFGRTIDGASWFTWWFNHLPGASICPKRTPM